MVARAGIEPSTRGFSVPRRGRFGASKTKTGNGFPRGQPNRPARPSLFRPGFAKFRPNSRGPDPVQRLARIATELLPNLAPNRPRGASPRHDFSDAVLRFSTPSECQHSRLQCDCPSAPVHLHRHQSRSTNAISPKASEHVTGSTRPLHDLSRRHQGNRLHHGQSGSLTLTKRQPDDHQR